jgi:CHAT domain-containing protein
MPTQARICQIAGLTTLLLTACQSLPPSALVSGASQDVAEAGKPAGKNQVGEDCEFRPDNVGTLDVAASRSYGVWCGTWPQTSAHIFETASGPRADRPLASLVGAGAWRNYLNQFLVCETAADTAILDNVATAMMPCTRRNGGWPHIAFASTIDGRTYLVDGVPSSLPALETALAALSGHGVPASGSAPSSAAQLLTQRYGGQAFGSGDLDRYYGLMRLGNEKNAIDDFIGAEDAFRDAMAVQQRILGLTNPGLAMPLMHLALQISNQQRYAEAEGMFAQAGALVERAPDKLNAAQLDYYRALHASNRHDITTAKEFAHLAETEFAAVVPARLLASATGDASRHATADAADSGPLQFLSLDPQTENGLQGLIEVSRFEANLAYDAKAYDEAATYTRRARALLDLGGFVAPLTLPRVIRIAALSEGGKGDAGAADSSLAESTLLFDRIGPNEKPLAITLLLAGREARARGDQAGALKRFRTAAKLLRDRRLGVNERLLAPYLGSLMDEAAAKPAAAPAIYAEMFEASQLVQGGLTEQYIAKASARLAAGDQGVGVALRQLQEAEIAIKTLFTERDAESQKPPALQDAKRLQAFDAAIVEAERTRDAAEAATETAAPAYAQLIQSGASAKLVSELLAKDEGMLAIELGETASFGFLVTRGGVKAFRIGLTLDEASKAVGHLRQTVVDAAIPEFDIAAANELYKKLFGPVDSELRPLERLVISVSGPLSTLPLEVLVTEAVPPIANDDYRAVPFLLKRFALSYVPAPQSFVRLRQIETASRAAQPYVGFGDFRPPTEAQLAASFPPNRCRSDFNALSGLGLLPATRQEVTDAGKLLQARSSDIYLAANFNKPALRRLDLKPYRIVHFATHAFLPTQLRCKSEPTLLMSVLPQAANADEAFLDAGEVLSLDLDADLVILSACNTAGPNGAGGESLSGLARSFFFAGSRGILVTHWDVDDESTRFLITRTIANMRPGAVEKGTTADLRQAKLDLLTGSVGRNGANADFSHPVYWAPFVLIGDGVRAPDAVAEGKTFAPAREWTN